MRLAPRKVAMRFVYNITLDLKKNLKHFAERQMWTGLQLPEHRLYEIDFPDAIKLCAIFVAGSNNLVLLCAIYNINRA